VLVGQEAGDNVLESGKPHYDIMAFIGSKPHTSELSIYIFWCTCTLIYQVLINFHTPVQNWFHPTAQRPPHTTWRHCTCHGFPLLLGVIKYRLFGVIWSNQISEMMKAGLRTKLYHYSSK